MLKVEEFARLSFNVTRQLIDIEFNLKLNLIILVTDLPADPAIHRHRSSNRSLRTPDSRRVETRFSRDASGEIQSPRYPGRTRVRRCWNHGKFECLTTRRPERSRFKLTKLVLGTRVNTRAVLKINTVRLFLKYLQPTILF